LKKCPSCGLLNPDESQNCDCGENLNYVKVFDFAEEKKQNRKNLLLIIISVLVSIMTIYYFSNKYDVDWKSAFAKQFFKIFDYFHVDVIYGALVLMVIYMLIYLKDIKHWESISGLRKTNIVIGLIITFVILLICIERLIGL
jgi:hypothetical protein